MHFEQLTAGELTFSLIGVGLGFALALGTAVVRWRYGKTGNLKCLDWFVAAVGLAFLLLIVVGMGFLMGFVGGPLSGGDMAVGALMGLGGMASFFCTMGCAFSGLLKNNSARIDLPMTAVFGFPVVRARRD